MSKNSSKSLYSQLMEWLPTLGRTTIPKQQQSQSKFSKADHYKNQGVYGKASN
jgi:hypothetical protein